MLLSSEQKAKLYRESHSVTEAGNIPKVEHFAVLVNDYVSYDDGYGDHGRPSMSTKNFMNYRYFDNEDALASWIIENDGKTNFTVLKVRPVKFELKAVIKFDTK
jgi:hypothetical protein